MMRLLVVLPLLIGCTPSGANKEMEARDLGQFQGRWRISQFGKRDSDNKDLFMMSMEFDKDTAIINDDLNSAAYQITLGPTVSPKTIDLSFVRKRGSSPFEAKHLKGIYVLENGTLKICLAVNASARPTEFVQDNANFLIVLKRNS